MTYITEFKILERTEYDEGAIDVRTEGRFKFDGRLRKDQVATFIAFTGRDDYEDNVNFKVVVNKKSGLVRREMKACAQKEAIKAELLGYVHRENLRAAIREDEKENVSGTDSGTDSGTKGRVASGDALDAAARKKQKDIKSQMAAAHARSNDIIGKALANDPELARYVNNAIGTQTSKVSVDEPSLEIPQFLKRS